jgi:hypothetical protein
MIHYPFWISIEYSNFSKSKVLGYTGSITKERDLIDVIIRLDIEIIHIKTFQVNRVDYPPTRLQRVFDKAKHILEEESA